MSSTNTEATAPVAKKTPAPKKAAPAKKASAKKASAKKAAPAKSAAVGKKAYAGKDMYEGKKIKLLVKENPKRKGSKSAKRFDIYKNGMTVEQFLEKGGTLGDVRWDDAHEFVALH